MHSINKTAVIVTGCLLLALILLAPPATHGDEWNLATRFKVNTQFEVPNIILQPNTTYVIRLHDSPAERNIVQIYNQDQTKMLTMFMAISDERMEATDKTRFTFTETQPGYPLPIKEWFYPGRLRGLEFVYPKEQAMQIAQHAREPILAAESGNLHKLDGISVEAIEPLATETPVSVTAANTAKSESTVVTREKPSVAENVSPESVEQPVDQEQVAEQPLKSESQEVQREKPAEAAAATEQANEPRELPQTSGELPLIALIGTLCLGAGLGIKLVSSKS